MVNHPNRSKRKLRDSIQCVDGRAMRHDPQPDDPHLQTDIGECEECGGKGCDETDES